MYKLATWLQPHPLYCNQSSMLSAASCTIHGAHSSPVVRGCQLGQLSCGLGLLCCSHAQGGTQAHSASQTALLPAAGCALCLCLDLGLAVELVQGGLQDVEANPAEGGQEQQGDGAQPAKVAAADMNTKAPAGEISSLAS